MTHRRRGPAALACLSLAADTLFGLDLLGARLRPRPAGQHRSDLSPLSTSAALDLLAPGARGESAQVLARLLHQPVYGPEVQAALAARGASLGELRGGGDRPALQVSDRVCTQSGLDVRRLFLDAVATGQNASLRTLDFQAAPEKARDAINAVVAQDTAGLADTGVPRPARRRRGPPS